MKSNSRHCLIALGLCAGFLRASHADAPATNISPWRDQGVLSTDDVIKLLGVTLTAEQRAEIEKAVAQRNLAIQAANAQFSKAIFETLKTDDATLTKQMDEVKDREKMDRMKRFQPSRYQELQRKKKKDAPKD